MTRTENAQAERVPKRRWHDWLFHSVDGAWLAAFRVLFGIAIGISMLRFLAYGWVDRLFVEPSFQFKYWGFGWVERLPAPWMQGVFVLLAVSAAAVAAGFMFRLFAVVLTLGLVYFQLLDVSTYLNHYYLAALFCGLLAISPAGKRFSVDSWWRRRQGAVEDISPWIPVGWLYLFRFQVGLVYTFAGLAKLQSDWLIHAQPLRIWLGANTELPIIGPLFTVEGVPLIMSWCGFLFDTTIAGWLSWKKTRPYAYLAVIVFHVMTRVLFPIGMFPVFMVLAAMVFFEPAWPRELVARIARLAQRVRLTAIAAGVTALAARVTSPSPRPDAPLPSTQFYRVGFVVLGVYCAVQLLIPLRFLAYGGNVLWHEQGMRYSWRVMVRAKGGSTVFNVRNPATGQTWIVKPHEYLNDMQASEMSSQPDLIVQMAHHIRRDFENKGLGPVEVRVDARVALNGRRSAPFIDPDVDLTRVRDGLNLAHYVLPAPSEAPAHTRPVL